MKHYIDFDRNKIIQLKEAYDKAIADKAKTFMFEDCELMVEYAKYMLDYLGEAVHL